MHRFLISAKLLALIFHSINSPQQFALAGTTLEAQREPICQGPAPAGWGQTPASITCPAWTSSSASATCVRGFGAPNWRCSHRNCYCSYEGNGKYEIICKRATYFFSARSQTTFTEFVNHRAQFEQEISLDAYCTQHCKCPPLADNLLQLVRKLELKKSPTYPVLMIGASTDDLKTSSSEPDLSGISTCRGSGDGSGQCQSYEGGSNSGSSKSLCSIDCQGPSICHEARIAAGCAVNRCRANPQQSQESGDKFLALGSCVHMSATGFLGGRRRRRDDVATASAPAAAELLQTCVCNSTYISLACCGSDSGLVWEEERFGLGQLDDL